MRDKCISCGRFFKYEPGASWAQVWSMGWGGEPEIHDPHWQCKACTEKQGPLTTNCAHPERYSGVLKAEPEPEPSRSLPKVSGLGAMGVV